MFPLSSHTKIHLTIIILGLFIPMYPVTISLDDYFFCTIFENECYLIPVNACGKDMCRLHLLPPQNGQIKNIRFAKDFQALKILNTLNK